MPMTPRRGFILVGGLCASLAVLAAPASYQCDGGITFVGDFSPRAAQVRLDGQQFTLQRAREAREARYASARDGITLTLVRSQATLSRKGQPPLNCTLAKRTTP
ncbi:MAG: MliC family protein [Vitreoscilla sp.]|nr:MliC family protein [Vitreoscilla sp.]